jgi:hypothetical protein
VILARFVATGQTGTEEISGILHDASGDAELVSFDEPGGVLTFPVAQEIDTWMDVPDGVARTRAWKRRHLPGRSLSVPFMQVNVTVRSATSFQLGPDNVDDPWMLVEIAFDRTEGRLVFERMTGPLLTVQVRELSMEAAVTDHVAVTVRRRVWALGAESDALEGDTRFRWPPSA